MALKMNPTHTQTEPVLDCPHCGNEIRLTESLAGPLIEESRRRFERQLAEKDAELARRTGELDLERAELATAREQIEDAVRRRLSEERVRITASETKRAREALAAELQDKEVEAAELRAALEANNVKLGEAQRQQAELIRKQRELDEVRREVDLTVEKRVEASLADIHTRARQEADNAARLRLMEKDGIIDSMSRTIQELKNQAEQASQQRRGEVFEIDVENMLRDRFPSDLIEPVAKGEMGADILQRVNGSAGRSSGSIIWELKRTKSWSASWLPKLRSDQRRVGADVALLVSHTLPKEVEHFDLLDGVWVAHPRYALPVVAALRLTLLEIDAARLAHDGQLTKSEEIYEYLTGARFRRRVEAAIEKFREMREHLDRERRFMTRQWAVREGQLAAMIETTSGMVGDMQAIAGQAMPEIASLEAPLVETATPQDA